MHDADKLILDHFKRTHELVIELLERVPENLLSRQAKGEDHPLHYQFAHMADGMHWWMEHVMKDGNGFDGDLPTDKPTILKRLHASGKRLYSFFSAEDGTKMAMTFSYKDDDGSVTEWQGRDRVVYFTTHDQHHRGKVFSMLRAWGFDDFPDYEW